MNDKNKIERPDDSVGQQPYWPGDKQLKPSDSGECPKKDKGTREHETTIIPEVR